MSHIGRDVMSSTSWCEKLFNGIFAIPNKRLCGKQDIPSTDFCWFVSRFSEMDGIRFNVVAHIVPHGIKKEQTIRISTRLMLL